MLIDNKYEVNFGLDFSKLDEKQIILVIRIPKNLKDRGILDQLTANTIVNTPFDDFPLT